MNSPYFTIAIPTYNRCEMLEQALESLRHQSFKDFEILIGDNGSTDRTKVVVEHFKDLPIRYDQREINHGAVENFNQLIQDAKGRFLVMHWDDDFLHQDFLMRAHHALKDREDRVAYAAPHWHGPLGNGYITDLQTSAKTDFKSQTYFLRDELTEFEGHRAAVKTLISFPMVFPTTAVRIQTLKAVGGYFQEFEFGGDVVTIARILSQGKVAYDARMGGYTRIHGGNSSLNQNKKWKKQCHRDKIQAILDYFKEERIDWRKHLRDELAQMTEGRIFMELKVLCKNQCNPFLLREIYERLKTVSSRRGFSFWRKLVSRIGFKNSLYLWKCVRR